MEAKLEPASAYTAWCEGESYARHTRAAFGAGLPLPLSYWLPWTQRRAALRRFGSAARDQVPPACLRSALVCARTRPPAEATFAHCAGREGCVTAVMHCSSSWGLECAAIFTKTCVEPACSSRPWQYNQGSTKV